MKAIIDIQRNQKGDHLAGESHYGNAAPPIEGPSTATSQFASQVADHSIGPWSGFAVPLTSSTYATPPSLLSPPYVPSPHQSSSTFPHTAAHQAQIPIAYDLQPEPLFPAHLSTDQSVHRLPESLRPPTPAFMVSPPLASSDDPTIPQVAGNLQPEPQPNTPFSHVPPQHPASFVASASRAQSLRTDAFSTSQSVLSSGSNKRRHLGTDPPIPSGLSQRLPYFSLEVANITSALCSMVGAMNNMTTTWCQAVTQTAEMSAVIVATDMVRDSADFTEDEKIQLYLFFNDNPMLAGTVPRMTLGFRKAFFRGILNRNL
jgi:hypothetical protein